MKIIKFSFFLLILTIYGCSYVPIAVDINKISSQVEPTYRVAQGKIISISPVVDKNPFPQNIGFKEDLSGYKKSEILITAPPAIRIQKDTKTCLENAGFRFSVGENPTLENIPRVLIILDQFSLNSKKDNLFRHKISANLKVTLELTKGDNTKITKKAETFAERKTFRASQKNLQKTAYDAWQGLISEIVNDDFFKNFIDKK